ncbi:hypothetical protein Tco_1195671 [Tanacetum coccineum]
MLRESTDFSEESVDSVKRAGESNRLMKAVQSSSYVSIVPSLSSSSHVFASPLVIRETSSGGQLHFRQFSGVEVDCFFDRKELFCFVDEVFDSEYVQVQDMVLMLGECLGSV